MAFLTTLHLLVQFTQMVLDMFIPAAVMTSLPVYHLVTGGASTTQCYAYFGTDSQK